MGFNLWMVGVGERKVGDQVNLERAMGAHVRFGGHFVQVSLSQLTSSQKLDD